MIVYSSTVAVSPMMEPSSTALQQPKHTAVEPMGVGRGEAKKENKREHESMSPHVFKYEQGEQRKAERSSKPHVQIYIYLLW